MELFHFAAAFPADLTLLAIGQYLLPVLLLLFLVRYEKHGKKPPSHGIPNSP